MIKRYLLTVSALLLLTFLLIFWQSDNQQKPDKVSGAYKALNFFTEQRIYPKGIYPDAAYHNAFQQRQQNSINKSAVHMQTPEDWQAIGPKNLGGRTLALAFNPQNPQVLYAGSASGGLWKSKTAGVGRDTWEYVPTGFPVLAVSSITFAPNDSMTIYIGTGEVYNYQAAGTGAAYRSTRGTYGIGILKSSDGGLNWQMALDWCTEQTRGVWAVKVNPLNPQTVWAGTTHGTYKSKDGGNSWTQVNTNMMVNDLVINPADTNNIIIGCGNFASPGFGLYQTLNGGQNWTKKTSGIPSYFEGKILLSVSQSNPNIVFASIGNGFSFSNGASWLCKSTDSGNTWLTVSTIDYSKWQGWFAHDVAVNPTDPNEVTVIGIEVYQSKTGGSNLAMISTGGSYSGRVPQEGPEGPPTYSHVDHHDVIYHPTDHNIIYFANDGGVFRSTNGGNSFQSCNGGYQTAQFYNGFASSHTDSLLAIGGLQDNSTTIYDGDEEWFVRLIGGDGSWAGIDPQYSNIMYGSWQGLNMLRSMDGGYNWSNIPPPGAGRFTAFIAPFVIAQDNPAIIYAGRDVIYKSDNRGNSWTGLNGNQSLDGNPALAMAVSPQNSDYVYVATAPYQFNRGHVFRSLNGGSSWQNITANLPDRFITDIAVNPDNHTEAIVTLSGFGTSHVFRWSESANEWEDIDIGLPDVPTQAVIYDPNYSDNVYIGNDFGVFATTQVGETTWTDFSEGLPDAVIVMDLSISPTNRKLRIASHGNGAYERDLLGPAAGIPIDPNKISTFTLNQNYPNPFNPQTNITYSIESSNFVSLVIYDLHGRKIKTLVQKAQSKGNYLKSWDGTDDGENPVASGTYMARLKVGKSAKTIRLTFTK